MKNGGKNKSVAFIILVSVYTALQKFGNDLENGVLDNIGMNPF